MGRRLLPNGVDTTWTFNEAGFVTGVSSGSPTGPLEGFTYQHDAVGNVTYRRRSTDRREYRYQYDDLYRLVMEDDVNQDYTWTYDRVGNRLTQRVLSRTSDVTTSYGYNAANRLTSVDGNPLSYDANGNLTGYGADTYQWDVRDRLVRLTRPDLTVDFSYDYLGRRASRTKNGVLTSFLYDGDDLVSEISGGSATHTLHGPVIDQPLARGGYYYSVDGLGSTDRLTDGDGNVVSAYRYTPFGVTTGGVAGLNPFQFTGRENDETGLYYYRARYYAPEWGRFISEDPIGLAGGINHYAYVGNNPLTLTDPSGLLPLDTLLDLGLVAADLGLLIYDGLSGAPTSVIAEDLSALCMDVGFAMLPYASAAYTRVPALMHRAGAIAHAASAELEMAWMARTGYLFARGAGRCGKQQRLKELGDDPKVSSADRGWIKQERNAIARKKRRSIRVPPGKELAHRRGKEARKGFGYKYSDFQNPDLHDIQHGREGYR